VECAPFGAVGKDFPMDRQQTRKSENIFRDAKNAYKFSALDMPKMHDGYAAVQHCAKNHTTRRGYCAKFRTWQADPAQTATQR
jgi:hypothetical protein